MPKLCSAQSQGPGLPHEISNPDGYKRLLKSEDVWVPITSHRGESKYDVTAGLYSID